MRSLLLLVMAGSLTALAADGALLKAASELPDKAQALRDKGLDAEEVNAALEAAKEAKLSAGDAAALLDGAAPLVEKHGPIENFGDFVKEKLGEGLRGEELAAAIKAKHEGKGAAKPKPTAKPGPKPTGKVVRPTGRGGPGKVIRDAKRGKSGGRR